MNRIILMGRLVRDPELRITANQVPMCQFSLAVDRRFKNQDGERQTDFIRCVAWRQTAEFIERYFNQGSRIAVVGSIQTGSYEKDGQKLYTTDVIVEEVYFADSKRSHDGQASDDYKQPVTKQAAVAQPTSRYQQQTYTDFVQAEENYTILPFEL